MTTFCNSRDMNGPTFKYNFPNFHFHKDFENMGLMAKENVTMTAKKQMLVPNVRRNIHQTQRLWFPRILR